MREAWVKIDSNAFRVVSDSLDQDFYFIYFFNAGVWGGNDKLRFLTDDTQHVFICVSWYQNVYIHENRGDTGGAEAI